ncbi:Zn-ribbon domain-containing OB-fold protein [Rhodococcus wratislaviensis]|uniref:DUF35 domain-containing protein n=1 Tax=Rhodococcus wratislaviensis NBRC 100605 TaxID=1219028 RepID=X0Q3A5_RHOWR|nr:OB-fold domain-containing protein [Rhodococcus wratislaviensis]GAF45527.1 hypothetical protein RW1_022_01070 [Rhodococcus wratislaviensis NBRC 100605]
MSGGAVPGPTPETAEYWQGTREGQLRIQRCNACECFYFYPRPFCRFCSSRDVAWHVASGRGQLISYVINYRPLPPASSTEPQIIALVELDEGPRLMTNLIGVDPDPALLPLDARVEVDFEPRGDQMVPVFRMDTAA